MKVATIKLTRGLTVDWGRKVICNCVCTHCGSGLQMSNVCSKHVESALRLNYVNNSVSNMYFIGTDTNQSKGVNSVDTCGRPKLFYKGCEVCNNFLPGSCVRSKFKYAHVSTTSTASDMSQNATASLLPVNGEKKQLSPVSRKCLNVGKATTLINIDGLEVEL